MMKYVWLMLMVVCVLSSAAGARAGGDWDRIVKKVATDKKHMALTFDDGPSGQTPALLKLFGEKGVKATFFVKGCNVAAWPNMAKKMVAAGHELGNHSYTHPKLPSLSSTKMRGEVETTQTVIINKVGYTPTLFRAPYLKYSQSLFDILNEHKLTSVNASISTKDWDKATTSDQITERTLKNAEPGAVVLMHGWNKNTLVALPGIIDALHEQGYTLVTVSAMIKAAGDNL